MKRFRPGVTFGDFVVQDWKVKRSKVGDGDGERDYRRGWLVWMGVVIGFGLLLMRLVEVQLVKGTRYRVLADENRIKKITLTAPRGKIMDRNGQEMVRDESTAHVVGYMGQVSEEEVGLLRDAGTKYEPGGWIGRSGIEAQYEEMLRGVDGGKLVEVDNEGKVEREIGKKEAESGKNVTLTLDSNLQSTAYTAVKGKKAGVIVSDPRNGEILALVSSPSFDPDEISTKYEVLSARADMPFFNRAIGGVYPPGSTFKMITTAAALESGRVEPEFSFNDQGIITVGAFKYTNWLFTKRGKTEGVVGFSRAITRSTDTFFYKVGEMTGPQNILEWSKKMGLGGKTGIDLPGEVAGFLPDPKTRQWYLGNTYHLAIGQEDTLATPLQINLMTNVLASLGKKCRMHLFRNDKMVKCENVEISPGTLDIIRRGMIGACSLDGTSYVMFDWNANPKLPKIACKTGTAEYVAENGKMKTHGWLTAYAPVDNPVISATVVIEGGGEGSDVAAPVVRKIFARYFGVADTFPYGAIRGEGE